MSLAAPLGLLLGLLGLPVLALYFLRPRRKRVVVPSLLLWHAVRRREQAASPFDRFRRNLLLLLQLLLLAALALALAKPYLHTEAAHGRSVVLLLDTSASMRATDGTPTRLDSARQAALELLDGLSPTDEAMLVTAGSSTRVEVPFGRDHGALARAVREIRATEAEGSLREGLQLALSLARSRPETELVVLSDGGNEALGSLPLNGADLRYLRQGSRSTNAGIVALDLRRSPTDGLGRELFVTVRNVGPQPVEGSVELYLDGDLLELRTPTLPTDEPVSLVFALGADRVGELKVVLDTPGDLLPTDDEAYALLEPSAAREVVLVGTDPLTARVLAADPRVHLSVVRPAEATPERLAGADAAFFLAGVPPEGSERLNRALLSRAVPGPARLGGLQAGPRVMRWERTHPLLRFLEPSDTRIARSAQVLDPGGLVGIVDGSDGPLLLAGETGGARVLQLAFDPFESDLPLRVAWPVLLLNAVGWLTEDQGSGTTARLLPTGAPWTFPVVGDGPVRASGPEGALPVDRVDGQVRVLQTTTRGLYRVEVDGRTHRFAADLLSERETHIRPALTLDLDDGESVASASGPRRGRRELWPWLIGAALVVLLAEWWVWNRRVDP